MKTTGEGGKGKVRKMVDNVRPLRPPKPPHNGDEGLALPAALDLMELANTEPRPPAFVVRDWIPAGEVTLLAGHGGAGKSYIALHLGACVALGRQWYGLPTERRRVVFLSLEDSRERLHFRIARICAWMGVGIADLRGRMTLLDGSDAEAALFTAAGFERGVFTTAFDWLRDTLRAERGEVLILDTARDAYDANENERRHVRRFVRGLRALVPRHGAAIVSAHVDKLTARNADTSQGFSGSTAWHNSVRSRLYLRRESDGSEDLLLECQKVNDAREGAQLRIRWNGEAQRAGTPAPSATTGTRTTYYVLSQAADFPQLLRGAVGKTRFWGCIERMRASRAIVEAAVRGKDRHWRSVLEVPQRVESEG